MIITYRGGLVLDIFVLACKLVQEIPGPSDTTEYEFNAFINDIMRGDFG